MRPAIPNPSALINYRTLLALIAMLVLTACAGPKYEQDFKAETNFSRYQTYAWQGGRAEIETLQLQRLQNLVQQQLAAQGYQLDAEDPDLLITLNAFTRRKIDGSRGLGLSIGIPLGDNVHIGVGGSKSLPREQQEGILAMDVIDARSNKLLWRGTGTGIPLEDFRLAREQQLQRALEKLVAPFPPQ